MVLVICMGVSSVQGKQRMSRKHGEGGNAYVGRTRKKRKRRDSVCAPPALFSASEVTYASGRNTFPLLAPSPPSKQRGTQGKLAHLLQLCHPLILHRYSDPLGEVADCESAADARNVVDLKVV
jgi:hypothetical protein